MVIMEKIRRNLVRFFKSPTDILSTWINQPARYERMVDFLNWFDSSSSVEETVSHAQRDWDLRITNFPDFDSLNKECCLEIGFGGGRLMVPASRIFKRVIGIDVHLAFKKTREFLRLQNIENFQLKHRNELQAIESHSVDFIWSFIVFQHFDSFKEVMFYLSQIKRILRPNGYCHIFFGKYSGKGIKVIRPQEFKKRECSLFIEATFFYQNLRKMGFRLIEHEEMMPKRLDLPFSKVNESGQARVLFKK